MGRSVAGSTPWGRSRCSGHICPRGRRPRFSAGARGARPHLAGAAGLAFRPQPGRDRPARRRGQAAAADIAAARGGLPRRRAAPRREGDHRSVRGSRRGAEGDLRRRPPHRRRPCEAGRVAGGSEARLGPRARGDGPGRVRSGRRREGTVFGRIKPEQKEGLVDALLRKGKRVAMMGDGANDVPALKKASLGIAMNGGSGAARDVADMILLKNSFAVLRPAFHEGRRIIGGMISALYLFLARVATTAMIIVAVTMIGLGFPFDPAQAALTTFTVGIPSFFLTLWAKPQRLSEGLLPSLARFVVPVAMVTTLIGAGI